jgi:hypothetical protein
MESTTGWTIFERETLLKARELLMRKPELIKVFVGNAPTIEKGAIVLVLSALLERGAKQQKGFLEMAVEITKQLKEKKLT